MSSIRGLWTEFSRPIRQLPGDLLLIVGYVILSDLLLFSSLFEGHLLYRLVGIPYLLFIPGYALLAAMFPRHSKANVAISDVAKVKYGSGDIDLVERFVLSVVMSIVIVSLLSLLLNYTPLGVRQTPFILGITIFTVTAATIGLLRRRALPPELRYSPPVRSWLGLGTSEGGSSMHTIDKALILLVAITVLIAVASAGYAISAPRTGESFTEFYILMENEDGNLVASGYPRNITEGDERTIVIGVSNQEQRAQDYTVLVLLQQFMGENRTQTVGEEQVVYQYSISDLAYNRTNRDRFSFTPNMTGQNLRLAFLLYKGDLPQNPTVENAYRELHIWLAVTPAENDTSSSIYNPNTLRLS